jgi:hypothetical protein
VRCDSQSPRFLASSVTGKSVRSTASTCGIAIAADYLRRSDLHVTNKYLQATTRSKRLAQGKPGDAILPGGRVVRKQIRPNPLVPEGSRSFRLFGGRKMPIGKAAKAYWTQTDPDCFWWVCVNHPKELAGTTGLEPAASAVTGQRSNQLNYVPTRQIDELQNRQVMLPPAICIKCKSCLSRLGLVRNSLPEPPITSAHFSAPARCKTLGWITQGAPRSLRTGQKHQPRVGSLEHRNILTVLLTL